MKILILFAFALGSSAWAGSVPPVEGIDAVTGKTVRVGAGAKKGLVVVFLSAKCPCSNSHVEEIAKVAREYGNEFNFVAVHSNSNESAEMTKSYFAAKALPFSVIQDEGARLADRFKALKTPHVFVVRSDGSLAYQGGVSNSADCAKSDKNYLRAALEDLHAHREVRQAVGRTLGCVIKRG